MGTQPDFTQKASYEAILESIKNETLSETLFSRLELKSSWQQKHGKDISAIANHESFQGGWLIVGISDDGKLIGHDKKWAEGTEEVISNHINEFLAPSAAVKEVKVESTKKGFVILISIANPGDVTEWDLRAYKLTGTSSTEMKPDEEIALALKLPGEDFTKEEWEGKSDSTLVLAFASKIKQANNEEFSEELENLSSNEILGRLHLLNRNATNILFGTTPIRIAYYDENEDLMSTEEIKGAYNVLADTFISQIQNWTRKQAQKIKGHSFSVESEVPYPVSALREVLANAIAHALYQRENGGIIIDLHPDRMVVRNNAMLDAKHFSKQWFSKQTHVRNKLLMTSLRAAKLAEELGTGKARVFKIMLEQGKKAPIIEFIELKNYGKWSTTIFNQEQDSGFNHLLKKFYQEAGTHNHAKIAAALLLWKDYSWVEIQEKLDDYYKNIASQVIESSYSPVIVFENKIFIKYWARKIMHVTSSLRLSTQEEYLIFEILKNHARHDNSRIVKFDEARELIGLSNERADSQILSNLFRKWREDKKVELVRRKQWKFLN